MAFVTFPGPELYAAKAKSQSPKISYNLDRYLQAASEDFKGSLLSST